MNVQEMVSDLQNFQRAWEANRASPDLVDRHEWARGVVHGVKIATHRVTLHVTAQPGIRHQSGNSYLGWDQRR